MVSKTKMGSNVKGAVNYQFTGYQAAPTDKKCEVLFTQGIRDSSPEDMIADFKRGMSRNPDLGLAVWHTSLSFNPADAEKLDSAKMLEIGLAWAKGMGLDKTQLLIVRHHDRKDNQHLHLVASRVNFDGKTIKDGNVRMRSLGLNATIEKRFGLTTSIKSSQPELQHPERVSGPDQAKAEIRQALGYAEPGATTLPELWTGLQARDTDVEARERRDAAGMLVGVSFSKNGYVFTGSEIGRAWSSKAIEEKLEMNREDRAAAEQQTRAAMAAMAAEQAHVVELKSRVEQEFDRSGYTRVAELMSGQLPAAEQRLQEFRAQVEATPYGRSLLAEQRTRELEQAREAELAQAAELVRVAQRQAAEALEAEQLGVIRVAMAGIHTERPLIADLQERVAQAEKQGDYFLVAELRYGGQLQAAEQRLQGFQAQVDAIPNGRVLMAELEAQQEKEKLAKAQREEQAVREAREALAEQAAQRQEVRTRSELAELEKFRGPRQQKGDYLRLQIPAERLSEVWNYLDTRVEIGRNWQADSNNMLTDRVIDGKISFNIRYPDECSPEKLANLVQFLKENGGEVYERPDDRAQREKWLVTWQGIHRAPSQPAIDMSFPGKSNDAFEI
ncbi:relaxase/mobilization nuclease domain-containing protein [Hymenobacter lapidiphilus]|uniref:Relaxase/mobilization nuclease domain-containing protein n=1 Tax=Hymenobacter lapidiphilus TaxID=2608003 RepID=A0A7Y7U802_9BACT|nr:relaxase/mobilization nuclease domain-containing protein [Hymenobacter lapidiphilus]NVO33075.1 relaxase/mobilization nuclease domain-containing protein [Hymenobacter lapidiphilus]